MDNNCFKNFLVIEKGYLVFHKKKYDKYISSVRRYKTSNEMNKIIIVIIVEIKKL